MKLMMKKLLMRCQILILALLSVSYSCKQEEPDAWHILEGEVPENVHLSDHSNTSITVSWLRTEDAAAYTVQLLGSKDSESPVHVYTTVSKDFYRFDNLEEVR